MIKIEQLQKKFRIPIEDFDVLKKLFFVYNYNSENLNKNEFFSLKNINFQVKKGEKVFVIGKSGSGKTTLFSILSNKINYDFGKIEKSNDFFSSTLINMPPNLFPRLKLEQFINTLMSFHKIDNQMKLNDIKKLIIDLLKLSKSQLNTNFYEIDKGIFKLIILSISCFTNNKLYFFDNFNFNYNDEIFKNIWKRFLINSNSKTCLFFSCNNVDFIRQNADKVLILENSSIKKFDFVENFLDEELYFNFKNDSDSDLLEDDEM